MSLSQIDQHSQLTRSPENLSPPIGHVAHLWFIDLKTPLPNTSCLSQEEQDRLARLYFATDRNSFIARHVATREILARYLQKKPKDLSFTAGKWGKPALSPAPAHLDFNLSVSKDWALLAVSSGSEIGVDLEFKKPDIEIESMARSTLSSAEHIYFIPKNSAERLSFFYSCWTAKEAYLKCLGRGFSIDPRTVEVSPLGTDHDSTSVQRVASDDRDPRNLHSVVFSPDYAIALCTPEKILNLRTYGYEQRDGTDQG